MFFAPAAEELKADPISNVTPAIEDISGETLSGEAASGTVQTHRGSLSGSPSNSPDHSSVNGHAVVSLADTDAPHIASEALSPPASEEMPRRVNPHGQRKIHRSLLPVRRRNRRPQARRLPRWLTLTPLPSWPDNRLIRICLATMARICRLRLPTRCPHTTPMGQSRRRQPRSAKGRHALRRHRKRCCPNWRWWIRKMIPATCSNRSQAQRLRLPPQISPNRGLRAKSPRHCRKAGTLCGSSRSARVHERAQRGRTARPLHVTVNRRPSAALSKAVLPNRCRKSVAVRSLILYE